jgi:PAS domain S-box-containing protein
MTRRPLEELSNQELIHELEKLETAARRYAATAEVPDRESLIHELQVHQVELEMQNRELREAQLRVEEASERYADLYEFAPAGYCTLDLEGRIREINLTAAAMLGGPRSDLVGRSLSSLLPLESRDLLKKHLARCRTERARVTSELALTPGPAGARTIDVVSEPIVNGDGVATTFRTSLVDISARKQLELDLRLLVRVGSELAAVLEPAQMFETVARVVVPAVADLCMIDVVGEAGAIQRPVVVFADPSHRDLVEPMREFVQRPGWQSAQARVIASGEPMLLPEVPGETRTHVAYDDRHAAILRAANIRSELIVPLVSRNRTLGALTLAAAESGRRYTPAHVELARALADRVALAMDNARLFADARRAISARDATLGVVSHDLRGPLGTILLWTQVLAQRAPDEHVRARIVDAIQHAGQRMRRLVSDLSDVASIEANRLSIERAPHTVASLIDEAIDALKIQAAEKSVVLELRPPAADLQVACDPVRIGQVLTNLIDNAIKFVPAGGRITVSATPSASEVRLSVADSGGGIPPADLPRVFDLYWQARDTARLGRGLGLAIAKGIVEAHGGRIWVESESGVGSTFHFTLPRIDEARESPPPSPPGGAVQQRPATVLIVDDDPELREALSVVLGHRGYDIATAENGVDALVYLRHAPAPAAILLDLAMPIMDGWTFLEERARDRALGAIPVLVMSGSRDAGADIAVFDVRYVEKPVRPERLLDELARTVR